MDLWPIRKRFWNQIAIRKFRANRSLRDVEPEVNLFLRELSGRQVEEPA